MLAIPRSTHVRSGGARLAAGEHTLPRTGALVARRSSSTGRWPAGSGRHTPDKARPAVRCAAQREGGARRCTSASAWPLIEGLNASKRARGPCKHPSTPVRQYAPPPAAKSAQGGACTASASHSLARPRSTFSRRAAGLRRTLGPRRGVGEPGRSAGASTARATAREECSDRTSSRGHTRPSKSPHDPMCWRGHARTPAPIVARWRDPPMTTSPCSRGAGRRRQARCAPTRTRLKSDGTTAAGAGHGAAGGQRCAPCPLAAGLWPWRRGCGARYGVLERSNGWRGDQFCRHSSRGGEFGNV